MRNVQDFVEKWSAWVTKSPQFVADLPPHTKLGSADAKESIGGIARLRKYCREGGWIAQLNIKFPFVVWKQAAAAKSFHNWASIG